MLPPPDPLIVYANFLQFGVDETSEWPSVHSRMLVWGRNGRGRISVNGEEHSLEGGDYLFLPWKHRIAYRPSPRDPFLVAGIHVIPRLDGALESPPLFDLAHFPDHPLAGSPARSDAELPFGRGLLRGSLRAHASLEHLAEFIVLRFGQRNPDEGEMRTLGRLLLDELRLAEENRDPFDRSLPPGLRRVLQYCVNHLDQPISLDDMAEVADASRSTIGRLFREHLETTPGAWLLEQRLAKARRLLQTTRLQVSNIGQQCGIPDPYYFSKVFKKTTGWAPLAYRRARGGL